MVFQMVTAMVTYSGVKKYHIRWCSKFAVNFGQHYSIILADLLGMQFKNSAWCLDSDLVVSWSYCEVVIELVRNWQGISIVLVSDYLDAKFLCLKFWSKLWNSSG
jgi:hypothetical protein